MSALPRGDVARGGRTERALMRALARASRSRSFARRKYRVRRTICCIIFGSDVCAISARSPCSTVKNVCIPSMCCGLNTLLHDARARP